MNINDLLASYRRDDYQRDNFDKFLKHIKFSYQIPSIHIAGTNGKGGTARYLESIYLKHGYKVGVFNSPYLFSVCDMIRLNDQIINEESFLNYFNSNEKLFKKFNLSSFEIETFIALSYFNDNQCDIAIIECGMGGEIDATNIFTSIASIITSISLEHTSYLGRSLCEIAYHKAGIIKEEVPVITGQLNDEAMKTITEVALEKNAPIFTSVDPAKPNLDQYGYSFSYMDLLDLHIKSFASYSLKNACLAIETIKVLMDKFPVDEKNIKDGLDILNLPCRLSFVSTNPLIVIDGAHNQEGISNLASSLPLVCQGKPIHAVFCCFMDKNIERMLSYLGEVVKDITLTTFDHPRARKFEDYFLFADDYPYVDNAIEAIQNIIDQYPNDAILITGSLAFASYVISLFKDGTIKHDVSINQNND